VLQTWVYQGERRPGAGHSENGGYYVNIRDAAGNRHYYAHMADLKVGPGDTVRRGQQIGTCGDTGNAAGGCPHLHYGIRDSRGQALNPYTLLRPSYDAGDWQGAVGGSSWSWAWVALGAIGAVGGLALWWKSR